MRENGILTHHMSMKDFEERFEGMKIKKKSALKLFCTGSFKSWSYKVDVKGYVGLTD